MIFDEPLQLTGEHVILEPLSLDHVHQLVLAANEDRGSFGWTPVPSSAGRMTNYVAGLLADRDAGRVLPFAQRRTSDLRIVGCTRFLEPRAWPDRAGAGLSDLDEVEIGGTWLAASAQRSAINTEAKLLLLTHAFEHWQVQRVAICTDARNTRSRDAIERVGASFEGVLRRHRMSAVDGEAGTMRDTAMYAIVAAEWPKIAAQLRASLERDRS